MNEPTNCGKCNGNNFTEISEGEFECQDCYEITALTGSGEKGK